MEQQAEWPGGHQQFLLRPIGVIRTPHTEVIETPIQPLAAKGIRGRIILDEALCEGLADLEGFSHITLIYLFHRTPYFRLKVIPFMDSVERGIFATKAPARPNHIGISTVRLLHIETNILHIEEVDMLDETPLLDIKPFVPRFDNRETHRCGWFDRSGEFPADRMKADARFHESPEHGL